ncbi:hypothetical protein BaRGS_00002598 [Batillaria attramentaria]|uniref:Uncharacterized protein n=1 Tax=Batillaria attramentaria TaxID=370345 RepID=A0ABD0M3X8_9CAEN
MYLPHSSWASQGVINHVPVAPVYEQHIPPGSSLHAARWLAPGWRGLQIGCGCLLLLQSPPQCQLQGTLLHNRHVKMARRHEQVQAGRGRLKYGVAPPGTGTGETWKEKVQLCS